MKVLITGAAGRIGTVLSDGLEHDLRLTDVVAVEDPRFVRADLTSQAEIDAVVEGMDAVVHLGAVPDEAPFEELAPPNLYGTFHVFDACRRLGVPRVVYASSNHATGMYRPGEPLDEHVVPRPDGLYGVTKVYGEALGRMYVERFGLECVALRIGTFAERPPDRRALATWLSHADAIRLVDAALTAPDVGFAIVYGASANTRRWWPITGTVGYAPVDNAEDYAAGLPDSPDYMHQGGRNIDPSWGGWAV